MMIRITAAALLSIPLFADAAEVADYAAEIAEAGKRIIQQGTSGPLPGQGAPSQESLQGILDHAQRVAANASPNLLSQDGAFINSQIAETQRPSGNEIVLFVSWSMGDAALAESLATASATGMTVLFRGIPDGDNFPKAFLRIHQLVPGVDPVPNVLIDPPKWAEWGIDTVPTMVLTHNGTPIARVRGLTDPAWLQQEVSAGRKGDLGTRGPTAVPSERDLMAVLQEKAAGIDWESKRESAIQSYWDRAELQVLPHVTRPEDRRITLASRVTKDIVTPEGVVIARAGDIIDPLRARPFTQRLVIFDATDKDQMAFAAAQARDHRNTVLMTTDLDRSAGWDGMREINAQLGSSVYLLTPDIRDRYRIRSVPSVVYQSEEYALTVSEVCLKCAN